MSQFSITTTNVNGDSVLLECITRDLPVTQANDTSSSQGCQNAKPTSAMEQEQVEDILCLTSLPALMSNVPFVDQIGIFSSLINFAQDRLNMSKAFTTAWENTYKDCYARRRIFFGVCTICCKNKDFACNTRLTELITIVLSARSMEVLWEDCVNTLLNQQDQMLAQMDNYDLNQQMLLEFTALAAQVNEQIAESNLTIAVAEDKLLDLKNKELKQKATYVILPIILIVGIALIFND